MPREMPPLILVIDDEPDLLTIVHDILVLSGYRVLVADHPDTVLAPMAERHPDLFLIDMMLPQMTGIELAQHLCGQGYGATPMIAMSASPLMCRLAADSGLFAAILAKPFELSDLLDLLQRQLNIGGSALTIGEGS